MSTAGWAIDLGTTNSGVARWDDAGPAAAGRAAAVCREPGGEEPLEAPRLVPIGRAPALARRSA